MNKRLAYKLPNKPRLLLDAAKLRRNVGRVCQAWHLTSEVQVLVPGIRRAEG